MADRLQQSEQEHNAALTALAEHLADVRWKNPLARLDGPSIVEWLTSLDSNCVLEDELLERIEHGTRPPAREVG